MVVQVYELVRNVEFSAEWKKAKVEGKDKILEEVTR